jgi:hypothetical protein
MTKQTKTLLGLAVIAGVGYYAYTQFSKPKASFANLIAPDCSEDGSQCPCLGPRGKVTGTDTGSCPKKVDSGKNRGGESYEICANGHICYPKGHASAIPQ